MSRSLGLNLIITFYSIIGGVLLGLTLIGLLSFCWYGLKLYFISYFLRVIAENTIFSKELLISLPNSIMVFVAISLTLFNSIFHILLAEFLFLNKPVAYFIGMIYNAYSVFSCIFGWLIGENTLKVISGFLLIMNSVEALYLYYQRQ